MAAALLDLALPKDHPLRREIEATRGADIKREVFARYIARHGGSLQPAGLKALAARAAGVSERTADRWYGAADTCTTFGGWAVEGSPGKETDMTDSLGHATTAELAAADAALPERNGVRDEDLVVLDKALRGGASWEQAVTALLAGRPQKLQPSAESLAAWRATVEARAAGPLWYPDGAR